MVYQTIQTTKDDPSGLRQTASMLQRLFLSTASSRSHHAAASLMERPNQLTPRYIKIPKLWLKHSTDVHNKKYS